MFDGADAMIHLAWLIQPSHDERMRWATTSLVRASRRRRGEDRVPTFIAASSVGDDSRHDSSATVPAGSGAPYSCEKGLAERT